MKSTNFILPLVLAWVIIIAGATYIFKDCNMEKNSAANTSEKEQIIANVDNVWSYADFHNWNWLKDLFADNVILDYQSFTGQPAETLSPDEIISRWEWFLPGFDITQHKNSNHKITKDWENYKVKTDVRAIHSINWVHGWTTWIVDGSYDFVLNKDYKITAIKLNFDKTIWNNNLPNIALGRANFDKVSESQKEELAKINNKNIWPKPVNTTSSEQENNPNIKVVQDFFIAYGKNDLDGIRKVMAADVEWYIPWKHKLSGTKKWIDEVVGFFKLLQKAKFMAQPMILAANDNYVIDAHRGWSNTGENDIDMNWALLYKIEDGKIKQVQNFSADSYSADKFFDSVYTYEDAWEIRTELKTNNKLTKNTMETITFDSNGDKLVWNLYFPENYNKTKKYPAIVVVWSWTTVKEQMAWTYADKFSKEGYITLAFDARGYWESEWEPRFYESPDKKVEDINNAVSYLKSRNDVEKIWAFWVCAGSGYVLVASSENSDIEVVWTAASWIHDGEAVKLFYGGEEGVQEKITAAQNAKKKFAETWEMDYIKTISTTDTTAAMYGPFDYYLNPQRGGIPEWSDDKFAVASWEDWLTFDPNPTAKNLNKPTIMVHSDGAVLSDYTRSYFENITTSDKKLVWLDTELDSPMHQFYFYDQDAEVNRSIEEISNFFNQRLK
jgi:ketosteroid isomerase-like protein/fermentation-respiration switch protein FrsA (DUF1100 family)